MAAIGPTTTTEGEYLATPEFLSRFEGRETIRFRFVQQESCSSGWHEYRTYADGKLDGNRLFTWREDWEIVWLCCPKKQSKGCCGSGGGSCLPLGCFNICPHSRTNHLLLDQDWGLRMNWRMGCLQEQLTCCCAPTFQISYEDNMSRGYSIGSVKGTTEFELKNRKGELTYVVKPPCFTCCPGKTLILIVHSKKSHSKGRITITPGMTADQSIQYTCCCRKRLICEVNFPSGANLEDKALIFGLARMVYETYLTFTTSLIPY